MAVAEQAPKPGLRIDIPSVPNLRDLGGYAIAGGGRVRPKQLYRSVELNHLEGPDLERFAQLGIRTVFDLRTAAERAAEPDPVLPGTEQVVCDVLADSQSAAPARLLKVVADPALAGEMPGDGKALALFERGYREIVSLPSALTAYREFFARLARTHLARRCFTAPPAKTAPAGAQRQRCCCSVSPSKTCSTSTS
jgi:protein-tyrosine phosphatase